MRPPAHLRQQRPISRRAGGAEECVRVTLSATCGGGGTAPSSSAVRSISTPPKIAPAAPPPRGMAVSMAPASSAAGTGSCLFTCPALLACDLPPKTASPQPAIRSAGPLTCSHQPVGRRAGAGSDRLPARSGLSWRCCVEGRQPQDGPVACGQRPPSVGLRVWEVSCKASRSFAHQ